LPVLNQPPHRVGALLDQLSRRMRLHAESVLAPLGLRPRHLVALTVLRDRGGSTQQALSTTLMMDRANVVGLLNDLEADGLIERTRSPEDRRRHMVQLTDAGSHRLARAEFALARVEDEVLCGLGAEQRDTLYELLQTAASGADTAAGGNGACVTAATETLANCVADDPGGCLAVAADDPGDRGSPADQIPGHSPAAGAGE
jgi:DNA-binding MarR family transcriptional regulator